MASRYNTSSSRQLEKVNFSQISDSIFNLQSQDTYCSEKREKHVVPVLHEGVLHVWKATQVRKCSWNYWNEIKQLLRNKSFKSIISSYHFVATAPQIAYKQKLESISNLERCLLGNLWQSLWSHLLWGPF